MNDIMTVSKIKVKSDNSDVNKLEINQNTIKNIENIDAPKSAVNRSFFDNIDNLN
jgi:hypothetical protein